MNADLLPPDCLRLLSRILAWGRNAVPITVDNARQSGECLRALYALGLIELRQVTAAGNSVYDWQNFSQPAHTSAMGDALHYFLNPPIDTEGPVRGSVTVRATDAGVAALKRAHERPDQPTEIEQPKQSEISIDEAIQALNDRDRGVFRTIYDFEHEPYPNEPERIEGCDELSAPHPVSITPVPSYLIKGVHWPDDPSPSLLALIRLELIQQPAGVYHRGVHCRLPSGRVLRVDYELKRAEATGDREPSHFVAVYVDGKDKFCHGSATWSKTPNAYELTRFGLRVARKMFSPETGGPKLSSEGTPDKGSDAKNALRILDDQFAVELNGKHCELGNTLQFKLLKRLAKSIGRYVSIATLRRDVWREETGIEKSTIQQNISTLRRKLEDAGITEADLRIDGSQRDHYGIILGGQGEPE